MSQVPFSHMINVSGHLRHASSRTRPCSAGQPKTSASDTSLHAPSLFMLRSVMTCYVQGRLSNAWQAGLEVIVHVSFHFY